MLHRGNLFLLCLLLLQVALLALALAGRGDESREAKPLLVDFDVDAVDSLTLADDLDASLSLARSDTGWALPAADDFPVKGDNVQELLAKLRDLDTARIVAANPANFPRLLVAESDFRRKLVITAGEQSWTLFLGGSAGADTAYTRLDGENKVYLGTGLSAWDASTLVTNWIDASYAQVSQEDLLSVDISNDQGDFRFARDGDEWEYLGVPDDAEFEDTTLPGILRSASSIRMVKPLGLAALSAYGMAQPAATVQVTYQRVVENEPESQAESASDEDAQPEPAFTESSYTLVFGAELDDGNIALKSSDREYYVAIRDTTLKTFLDISHDSLLRTPQIEAPEPTPAG